LYNIIGDTFDTFEEVTFTIPSDGTYFVAFYVQSTLPMAMEVKGVGESSEENFDPPP
jgi:hypothetical protein